MKRVFRKSAAMCLVLICRQRRSVLVAVATGGTARRPRTSRSASCSRTRSLPFAGCSSTRRLREGAQEGRGDLLDQQRAERSAEAEGAGADVPGGRREGRIVETSLDRLRIAIEKLFTSKGGKAIDYDRQVLGGTASVYISFDNPAVGKAQANGIIAGLKAKGKYGSKPVVAELWGGQTDQNAFAFKSGNDAVLNPLFKSGKLTKGPQQFVPDWLATNAAPIFSQMLVKTSNKIDAAIAANDNIAGAVIATLKAKHLQPIPLSGQDASAQGVQYILAGWQTDGLQVRARRGERRRCGCRGLILRQEGHTINGPKTARRRSRRRLPIVWITKANYKRLFTDGFLKKSQVCIGAYKQYCK